MIILVIKAIDIHTTLVDLIMEDQSIFTKNQPKEISEGLQSFIDSMVEEIVLEGKPFDSQKKYLKKFSEKEGLDYEKLETDIISFIEIIDNLKNEFSILKIKLTEEKGRDCHISEKTIQKLIKHSSLSRQKNTKQIMNIRPKKKRSLPKLFFYGGIGLLFAVLLFLIWPGDHQGTDPIISDVLKTDTVVVIQRDTIIMIQYSTEAEQKYRVAAEQGDATAQFNLGCYYYSGEKGAPQSYSEAVKWYKKAADQGHPQAQNNLGYCYEKGYGVSQDLVEAIKLYNQSASQGDLTAKANLERLERNETIVDLGLPSGLKWARFNLGARSANDNGKIIKYGNDTNDMIQKEWKGMNWRLPTSKDFNELFSCQWDWTESSSSNGDTKTGFTITGHNGNKMFLPFPEKSNYSGNPEVIIHNYLLKSSPNEVHWIHLMYNFKEDKMNTMLILDSGGSGFVRMVIE